MADPRSRSVLAALLPTRLAGQIMLAIAVALLLAQTVNAVLLFRAQQDRAQSLMLSAAAFRLAASVNMPPGSLPRFGAARGDNRGNDNRRDEQGRRSSFGRGSFGRGGVFTASASPQRPGERRNPQAEDELRRQLAGNDIFPQEVVILRRGMDDRATRRWLERRHRRARDYDQLRPDAAMIVGIRLPGEAGAPPRWLVGRIASHPTERRLMLTLAAQTLVIFVVLFAALALLLRRITRPLAQLTERVRGFDGSGSAMPPLAPSGPSDIAELISAQNDLEARIAALLDEKDVMLGAIGHDLKTPLAALRVRVESVEDETERSRMAATIGDITRTLDDILSLARVGRPTDPVEPTDIAALTASVVEEFEDLEAPVTLADAPRLTAPVRTTWLRRALRNLITNALRYGSVARVTLDDGGGNARMIRLVISDDGPGIPDSEIERMMQPFTRLEASRNSATGGAGLGLTLARAIAVQHGGRLTLRNRRSADGSISGLDAELLLPR